MGNDKNNTVYYTRLNNLSLLNPKICEDKDIIHDICRKIIVNYPFRKSLFKMVEFLCVKIGVQASSVLVFDNKGTQVFDLQYKSHEKKIGKIDSLWNIKKEDFIKNKTTNGITCYKYESPYALNFIKILYEINLSNEYLSFIDFDYSKNKENNIIEILDLFIQFIIPLINANIKTSFTSGQHTNSENFLRNNFEFNEIIGNHPTILDILEIVSQVANTDATVLIQGDCGTGKELIARALYNNSKRKDKPFLPINCGAIPESLLESELFGHTRGAFTGAYKDTQGWFEKADHGTIFLDEVSKMSPALQVKLLRILQTGEYSLVGSAKVKHCNVRIIAASDKDLIKLVKENKFREDLLYRLNVITIDLPSLKERKSDILTLAHYFLKKFSGKYNKNVLDITSETKVLLLAYDYPGNVRELENAIERAILFTKGTVIESHNLPACMQNDKHSNIVKGKATSFREGKEKVVCEYERNYLSECLKVSNGNISLGSKIAGIDVKNFYVKMKKYEINPHIYKSHN